MPLSTPAPRRHIHSREIRCRGYRREDGLWDIEAFLVDTKTYGFDNVDRGRIDAGEPIHGMWIRLTVDEDLVVHAAEAAVDHGPFTVCGDVTAGFGALKGLRIAQGWRKAVHTLFRGTKGCTHLTDMLLGPLAATAYQTVVPARERRRPAESADGKPALLNTCHALASDGAVAKRRWPGFYTGS